MNTPSSPRSHILIYGTIAIDTLYAPTGQAEEIFGGSATFAALAARLLSDKAQLVGVVGSDFPQEYRDLLHAQGVGMQHVDTLAGRTFAWTARYEDDINVRETIETVIGVQEHWEMTLPESLKDPAVAIVCNSSPELQERFIAQCRSPRFIMLDSMKLWMLLSPEKLRALLARVDLALMNEEEAEYFAGTSDLHEAGRALLAAGPRYAIIKLGSKGSMLFYADAQGELQVVTCPALYLENAIDPTGAGDCYLGALGAYYGEHLLDQSTPTAEQWLEAMRYASTVAACVCEGMGTTSLVTTTAEIIQQRTQP